MSAVWGNEAPVVIHISVSQKQRILERTPRMLVHFDLTNGDFWIQPLHYLLFRVIQTPDLIHPRELAVVADAVGQRPDDPT